MTDKKAPVNMKPVVDVVCAYVRKSVLSRSELVNLVADVYTAFAKLSQPAPPLDEGQKAEPAVSIDVSVQDHVLVSLEDGRFFKSLTRHLRHKHKMSPEQYRAKWGLPSTYPMAAPSYAAACSKRAKAMGLGKPRIRRPPRNTPHATNR